MCAHNGNLRNDPVLSFVALDCSGIISIMILDIFDNLQVKLTSSNCLSWLHTKTSPPLMPALV